ncbi:MAG: hypothetical protein ABI724_02020 [Betaproteobacteria bacterium]
MRFAFNQFAAFGPDAEDNNGFVAKGKVGIPVLAVGAPKSNDTTMAKDIGNPGEDHDDHRPPTAITSHLHRPSTRLPRRTTVVRCAA